MKISELNIEHYDAFIAMVEDYDKNDHALYQQEHFYRKWTKQEFSKYLKECEKARMDWRPKAGKVSITRYVMQENAGPILACGLMRFPLNWESENDGGNLYVHVPPSMRRKGFGTVCLSLLLFEAVRAGLRRVMVTCPAADPVARMMIEKNRGQLLDVVKSTRRPGVGISRYWISFG